MSHYEPLSHCARYVYTRYYFHELRNGKTREDAGNTAMTKVKAETMEKLLADGSIDQFGKEERWANILADLVDWQRLLTVIPVDLDQLRDDMAAGKRVADAILAPETLKRA